MSFMIKFGGNDFLIYNNNNIICHGLRTDLIYGCNNILTKQT